ncbi:glycosyl transferase, partial [Adlercreutzia sp. JBNU-10]|nr:glycosyl transferase [Adlercreutzia sp. JBNU-10]
AYLHGHEVGGTNPSLLEGMASTGLCLLLDVGFNREVAGDAALYWTKEEGSLAGLIAEAEALDVEEIRRLGTAAKSTIEERFLWKCIASRYEDLFEDDF